MNSYEDDVNRLTAIAGTAAWSKMLKIYFDNVDNYRPFDSAVVDKMCIVNFTSRTGSTFLLELLTSNSILTAQKFENIQPPNFLPFKERARNNINGALTQVLQDNSYEGTYLTKGAIMPMLFLAKTGLFTAHRENLKMVQVIRRDKVAQAISLLKAEHTKIWHLKTNEHGAERIARNSRDLSGAYSYSRILTIIKNICRVNSIFLAIYKEFNLPHLLVTYEDVVENSRGSVQKILEFWDIPSTTNNFSEGATKYSTTSDQTNTIWRELFLNELKQDDDAKAFLESNAILIN